MDVLGLIEELQDLMEHASMFPWPGRRAISYDAFFRVTEEIKRALPEEVAQARAIMEQRDRVLAEAATQAREIIDKASEQSLASLENARRQLESMVSDEEVVRRAEARAVEIIEAAGREGDQIRAEADQYAADLLDRLSAFIVRMHDSVTEGRRALSERMAPPAAPVADSQPGP